jgi:hypothetical protein
MSVEAIDFASLALSRLTQQYKSADKFVQLVQGLVDLVQTEIDDPLENLITLYDIDIAEGDILDIIGEIVGQPRVIVDYDLLEFFGYDGALNAGTYGDANNPNVGARYLSSVEDVGGDKTLSDEEYRVFIRARILRNYSASTPEEIISAAKLILGVDWVHYIGGTMKFSLQVPAPVDANDLALIQTYDILPRPTGVSITSVTAV